MPRKDTSAQPYLPTVLSLPAMRAAVQSCRGCDLYQKATQAVFGEGKENARLVLVGEQPGDKEDLAGRPFVGPAGRLLDTTLEAVGIARGEVYVTNAVKHFKWKPSGKKRIHDKPTQYEARACRPWLEAELEALRPLVLVLLGATAAQSVLGASFRLTQHRGEMLKTAWAPATFATLHPAALLRIPDADARQAAREEFVAEFAIIAEHYQRAQQGTGIP